MFPRSWVAHQRVRCGSAGGSEGLDPHPGESWLGRGRKGWLHGGGGGGEREGEDRKWREEERKGVGRERKRKGKERERREERERGREEDEREIIEEEDNRGGEERKGGRVGKTEEGKGRETREGEKCLVASSRNEIHWVNIALSLQYLACRMFKLRATLVTM